ncbi:hypothetical protein B0H10DRAFT_2072165 [Mycena sp. CBHHK59/15]|nr:hypothetical protein B0H10DRAFT_2072165 [Mycena sp. CBHHK59/15]
MIQKIAITGCNGSVGKRAVLLALEQGYHVIGVDLSPSPTTGELGTRFSFLQIDLKDYDATLKALEGCDAIIHLAAFPRPGDYKAIVHNSNVVVNIRSQENVDNNLI